jgi:hypothetical protein
MEKRFHHALPAGVLGIFVIFCNLHGSGIDATHMRFNQGCESLAVTGPSFVDKQQGI